MKYLKAFLALVALAATSVQAENCHVVYNNFVYSDCGTFDCDELVTIGNNFGCQTTVDRDQSLAFFNCPVPEAEGCEEGRCVASANPAENCYNPRNSFVNDIFERISSRKKTKTQPQKKPSETQKQ